MRGDGPISFDTYIAMMSVYDADGFLSIQFDAFGEQESGVLPAPVMLPLGLQARPLDPVRDANGNPDPAQSCEVLIAEEGGATRSLPLGDPRITLILPQIAKGETLLYNSFGQFIRLDAVGTISLFTNDDGTINGQSILQSIGQDGFTRFGADFCKETLDRTGWHLVLPFGRIDFSYVGGMPAPFTALAGHFSVEAAAVFIEASAIALGPAAAPQQPIALGTSTVAALADVAASLGDAATAIAAIINLLSVTGLVVSGAAATLDPASKTFLLGKVTTITDSLATITAAAQLIESNAVTAY